MVPMPEPSELATFLRSRRERVSPESVGLPKGTRRRTPGLRREELAMLAGISVDYLVRLEQGRERNPSQSVLASLAQALRLEESERLHLGRIGTLTSRHPGLCPTVATGAVDDGTLAVLDGMTRSPAYVVDVSTQVLAWNDTYQLLMAPTGVLDASPPNLLRYTFLDERSRTVFADWDDVAREQVGNLRHAATTCTGDPAIRELMGELSAKSEEFARLWSTHDVTRRTRGEQKLVHPVVGRIDLRFEVLLLPDSPFRHLVVYMPADAAATAALGRLADVDRAPLRLVGGAGT
jgi:transcriptional regulator with XRE-family HTH domain